MFADPLLHEIVQEIKVKHYPANLFKTFFPLSTKIEFEKIFEKQYIYVWQKMTVFINTAIFCQNNPHNTMEWAYLG